MTVPELLHTAADLANQLRLTREHLAESQDSRQKLDRQLEEALGKLNALMAEKVETETSPVS